MLNINTVYPAFDGEQNYWGIGHPTIFVRFQGCHLRCYLKTLDVLCDTPEALDLNNRENLITPKDLVDRVVKISRETGIDKITISGGDPLKQNYHDIKEFIEGIFDNNILKISIETSGTLPWRLVKSINREISIVADYKLSSTGVKQALTERVYSKETLCNIDNRDFIKFVLYDHADYSQMREFLQTAIQLKNNLLYVSGTEELWLGNFVAGVYFEGDITNFELFEKLKEDKLLGIVKMNFQVHQMAAKLEGITKRDI